MSPQRVQGLRDLKQPANRKQLQSILGTSGFYAKFVENYNPRVEPLRRQLRQDAPEFVWTNDRDIGSPEGRDRGDPGV